MERMLAFINNESGLKKPKDQFGGPICSVCSS